MSYSSRMAYTSTSNSNCATYHDFQDLSHRPLQHRVHERRSQVIVTRYRIDNADNFSTSYYDRKEYTAHETHRSSFGNYTPIGEGHREPARLLRGNSRLPEATFERNHTYSYRPKQALRMPSERRDDRHSNTDRHYSSDYDTVPEKRRFRGVPTPADKGQGYTDSAYAKTSQQEELKPAYKSGYSSRPRTHSNKKPPKSDNHTHEKPSNSRSNGSRQRKPRSNGNHTSHKLPEPKSQARGNPPDFYAILKISHLATDDQIRSAAKRRRVEVHPDRLKRPGMSESEMNEIDKMAARVGEASDVLLNPEQRLKYDSQLYAAKGLK